MGEGQTDCLSDIQSDRRRDRQTVCQTYRVTDGGTDRLSVRHTESQTETDRLSVRHTESQTEGQTDCLSDIQSHRRRDRQTVCQTYRVTDGGTDRLSVRHTE